MENITFDVQSVNDCLDKNGIAYVVTENCLYGRDYQRVSVNGVGNCYREMLKEVTRKEDLEDYLEYSGFDNLDAWWKELGSGDKKYLYVVYLYSRIGY